MRTIGSRELKTKLGEVLRIVREDREEFVVTHRGQPIAHLVPETGTANQTDDLESILAEMNDLAEHIGRGWPTGISAVQAVDDVRRDL